MGYRYQRRMSDCRLHPGRSILGRRLPEGQLTTKDFAQRNSSEMRALAREQSRACLGTVGGLGGDVVKHRNLGRTCDRAALARTKLRALGYRRTDL